MAGASVDWLGQLLQMDPTVEDGFQVQSLFAWPSCALFIALGAESGTFLACRLEQTRPATSNSM